MKLTSLNALALAAVTLLLGCTPQPEKPFTEVLREALETASPGDVIEVPAGTFNFKRSLILNTDNVTLRGAGMDQSILNFKGQVAGAEGLSVNASNFLIEILPLRTRSVTH